MYSQYLSENTTQKMSRQWNAAKIYATLTDCSLEMNYLDLACPPPCSSTVMSCLCGSQLKHSL